MDPFASIKKEITNVIRTIPGITIQELVLLMDDNKEPGVPDMGKRLVLLELIRSGDVNASEGYGGTNLRWAADAG